MLGVLAAFASCEEDKEGYFISGTVENATEGQEIYVSELNESNTQTVPVDTVQVVDGKFELDLPEKDSPAISFLNLKGTRGNILYIADNTPISFTIYPDSLYASTVTGGKDNEILYNYLGEIKENNRKMGEARNAMREAFSTQDTAKLKALQQTQQEITDKDKVNKKELVSQNPNSIVSVMVLQDMLNTKMYSTSELRTLFDNLSAEVKQTSLAQNLDQNLKNMSRTDVGNKAPGFSAPTPEGNELSLQEALGEVTLVDFWASWCKPCRVENPNIVKVYEKYHDKGFNIIQVSLDRPGQKDKWIKAIEDDNLGNWNHVSNLKFWQDPIAAQYGVRAIPAAFLLDKEGNIVAKNLRGESLEQKVGELLNAEASN
ncbi:Thiol-disulfide isomerase or thioredoxin [Salinimicrobium catena]|uniref:Thiol-disulfide isomerase or thioredoxin n=2 Tax=Salinimicrobium catena TaxID=390640 RepID=A0A1H5LI77_9FLAO|nr:Thiol-disulfide isomerase or thioredoxin [Salinimicrobium catena]SEE76724.1 Thiol-disulfide isomerase or thioredoxin [Salinimicrobium catena]